SLGQLLPRAEVVVVTTPQRAAQQVAVRAAQMAQKTGMRLIGALENMSYLVGSGDEIFGSGGGEELAQAIDAPLLGKVPLDPRLREQADEGEPLVWAEPENETARTILEVAETISAAAKAPGTVKKSLPLAT
ncbi:MAG TPA: P-loop NTPase, partial [Gaiellaceae bacterium]|nr:P-loop NTPase [Gaiellaceae bacterium]